MQVGKILPYDLQKNCPSFYYEVSGHRWDFVTRVLHNEEQVLRCQLRSSGTAAPQANVKYWNMDGTEAAQFTIGSGGSPYTGIFDVGWLNSENKMFYAWMYNAGPNIGSTGFSLVKCLPDGQSPEVIMYDIVTPYNVATWSGSATTSGWVSVTSSDDYIYMKVGPALYEFDRSALTSPTAWSAISGTGNMRVSTNCFHYGDGSNCRDLMYQENSGDVLYTWYDTNIDALYLRSITTSGTTMDYSTTRWAMLNISEYRNIQYPLFLNQLDPNALHMIAVPSSAFVSGLTVTGTTTSLKVFNIDETLAAFLNVNSSDTVMPAGVGATADIIAKVINCWGTTLSGKLVQFWVSSGDGGVYPSYGYTNSSGVATTLFTAGANIGISNVAVVVNEV